MENEIKTAVLQELYRASIVAKVLIEVRRAEKKFPSYPNDPVHASAILNEEAGELTQACLDFYYERKTTKENMEKEAIQTAAMALRFLFNIDQLGMPQTLEVVEIPHKIKCALVKIHTAISAKMGDTDLIYGDELSSEELMLEDPLLWACVELATLIGDGPWDKYVKA